MNQAVEMQSPNTEDQWNEDLYEELRMKWLYAATKDKDFKQYTDAHEIGDKSACAALEVANSYLAELYDELGPCEYAEHQRYESLLVYWFDCFRKNEIYSKYCSARRNGDVAETRSLEAVHTKLRHLFDDWSDIHTTTLKPREWVRANWHLFYPADFHAFAQGLGASALKGELKSHTLDEVFKKSMMLAKDKETAPKYPLTPIQAETWSQLSQRISLAWYIYDMLGQDLRTKDEDNEVKIMTSIYFFESNMFRGMGVQQPRHEDGGPMTAVEFKNKRTTIEKMRETYKLCIEGTINGTFPAKHTTHK